MKRRYLLSLLVLGPVLWLGCERPAKTSEASRPAIAQSPAQRPKDAVSGDFDGDGTAEYAWLVPPKVTGELACQGGCTSYLRFSKAQLPAIAKENCIGGTLTNLGDLNGDGGDDIGLLPEWFVGCWVDYFAYTYRAGQWRPLVKPFATHCNQWEDAQKPIRKDPGRKGFVLIRYSESVDTAIVVKTKSVPVQ